MQHVDSIIHARWVIPVEANDQTTNDQVLEHHAIIIDNGRIKAIAPSDEARQQFQSDDIVELEEHALIPGLINAHTHVAMNLFRGMSDDLPLMTWLNDHIWPAEKKWISSEFVHDGSMLAIAEMLRGGTTCFNDMYFFPDITARVALSAGMRCSIGLITIDFPTVWAQNADEYLSKGVAVHDEFKNESLISTAFAPHAPYTVSDEALAKIRTLADEMDIPIHMHIHETSHEVDQAFSDSGKRPLQRLHELGLLSPRLLAVHMTQLTDQEITLCAEQGVHIIHCPESNLKLASGFCPVTRLLDAGANIALGTDSAASNNDLDMFGEMRTAALLAKGVAGDASALPAAQALYCATMGGAKALAMDNEIGSLTVGKHADITAVNLSAIETQPVYDPISHLVYCGSSHQVSNVWVNGKRLLNQGKLTQLDIGAIQQRCNIWRERLLEKP
ncbi:MAG: N-ethylammeline chlorohydrolase [Gammaproteobacteria bacterium]|nr:MAG: N-ethylammeline chlorohydrolase [Gammaproteobacteria bacterium]